MKVEPRLPRMPVIDVNALDKAVNDLNELTHTPPPMPRELPEYVNQSKQLGAAMIEAANNNLTKAQNLLEETKQYVEDMRVQIEKRANEMALLSDRLEDYRKDQAEAYKKFHGETPRDPQP